VVVAGAGLAALVRRRPAGRRWFDRRWFDRRWLARRRPGRAGFGHAAVLAAGTGLWLLAVAGTDPAGLGEFGLLGTVHPGYFAALLLAVAGFVSALVRSGPRDGHGLIIGGYLVLVILILHGTTPLLLDQPQYAWTYKHVGVVELLLRHGQLTNPGDLYQQWPALFAAVAGLSELSGVAPLELARWSPVFFNLAGTLVLLAIARTLSPDRRVAYLAGFGFLCVNWVEEDYLSPQAFAFLLGLGVLLVAVRWLRGPAGTRDGPAGTRGRWGRLTARLTAGLPPGPAVPPRTRAAALAVLLLLFAVLTATHQLSPYLVLAQLAVLAVLGVVRPWWTVPVLAAVAVGFLVPRFELVSGSFDLLESLNFFSNAAGTAGAWGSVGQAVSATAVRVLALAVWGVAGLAVWQARHRLGRVLVPAVLAATPFGLVLVQSYGGEAIYRVFLFSAPWCAYLIADLVLRTRARPGRVRSAVGGAGVRGLAVGGLAVLALAGAALATAQGRHGQLMVDRQTTAEVAAARYLYANAEPGATIALATPNFPSRLAGNYDQFNVTVPVGEPDLVRGAQFRDDQLDIRYLPGIENYLLSFDGNTSYLVVSDGMRRQADYFGYLPVGSLDTLADTLAGATGWSEFYRNQDVTIYQYEVPAGQSS
jgi:hypothetical protein